jgi:hypothetical protein
VGWRMKKLFENWRKYLKEVEDVNEDVTEYIPGSSAYKMRKALGDQGPIEYIKAGFSKLINAPEEFNRMIEDTKARFEIKFKERLESLAQSEDMQEIGRDIADKISQNKDTAALMEKFVDSPDTKQFSLEDLAKMGVGQETIELVAHTVSDNGAEALIEAAEDVIGKAAPPKVKDWLIRFVSSFIGSFVFGFIDNFIMVIAGSHIDAQFGGVAGAMVGSTAAPMLAAGFGNTVSDAVGELASNTIEGALDKMGLDPESVTDEQVAAGPMWMRFLDKQASVIGIVVGCLVGLFPLFLEEQNIGTPI